MNSRQKFETFLESLKGTGQDTLIESVKKGFKVIHESEYVDAEPRKLPLVLNDPDDDSPEVLRQIDEIAEEIRNSELDTSSDDGLITVNDYESTFIVLTIKNATLEELTKAANGIKDFDWDVGTTIYYEGNENLSVTIQPTFRLLTTHGNSAVILVIWDKKTYSPD